MAEMPEPAVGGSGRNPRDTTGGAPNGPAGRGHDDPRKQQLLEDRYQPQAVKRVDIPKPGGGMRQLGIPTVVDRLIQQALHQVLSPIFEAGFSDSSYGFRPGRSAHQAVLKAREYVADGKRWVEAAANPRRPALARGPCPRAGMAVGVQRTRFLVECWRVAHERGVAPALLRRTRARQSSLSQFRPASRNVNRRIRNRTYGGVGGRRA